MSPVRLDRSRREPDVWLEQKMLFFVTGAALCVAGMIINQPWLIWVAIAVLAAGLLLRIHGRMAARRAAAAGESHEDTDVEGDEGVAADADVAPGDGNASGQPDEGMPGKP